VKKRWLTDAAGYMFGSACFALSVSVFSQPHDIAPGGTAGLGILAHEVLGIPVGFTVLLLNLPLLAAAFFLLGRGYAVRSAVVIVLSSVLMDVSAPLLPAFSGERLLAALCGGLLSGLGIGIVMRRGASTGGTDIAAGLLRRRYRHVSLGQLVLWVDAAVIALSAAVFRDLSAALYAGVQVFITSLMIDHVVYGHEEGRLLLIVSRIPAVLTREITATLARGVTVLEATGGYTGKKSAVLLCAVSREQVPFFKEAVCRVDPDAFVMVLTTQQVYGEGFLSHSLL